MLVTDEKVGRIEAVVVDYGVRARWLYMESGQREFGVDIALVRDRLSSSNSPNTIRDWSIAA